MSDLVLMGVEDLEEGIVPLPEAHFGPTLPPHSDELPQVPAGLDLGALHAADFENLFDEENPEVPPAADVGFEGLFEEDPLDFGGLFEGDFDVPLPAAELVPVLPAAELPQAAVPMPDIHVGGFDVQRTPNGKYDHKLYTWTAQLRNYPLGNRASCLVRDVAHLYFVRNPSAWQGTNKDEEYRALRTQWAMDKTNHASFDVKWDRNFPLVYRSAYEDNAEIVMFPHDHMFQPNETLYFGKTLSQYTQSYEGRVATNGRTFV